MSNPRLRILLYGSNLWYFGEGMLGPLFALYTKNIGGSILDISWAWSTYLIVTGVLIIFIGKLSDDRFDKRKTMVLGYSLNALFTFGYLLVKTPVRSFYSSSRSWYSSSFVYSDLVSPLCTI